MKKVLIITSKYGSGHETVAKTIAAEFDKRSGVHYRVIDFGKILGSRVEEFAKKANRSSENNFSLHTIAAYLTNNPLIWKLFNYLSFRARENLEKEIRNFGPDMIFSTYPMANWSIASLKNKYKYKLITIITDLIEVLAYWVVDGTDVYITSKPEATQNLKRFGVKNESIAELGYPLRDGFCKSVQKKDIRAKYGIKREAFVSLCLFNTAPAGFSEKLASIMDSLPGVSNIIICGKNHKLYEILKKELKNTIVLGFVEEISDYFHIADVTIGKAGPGFIVESFSVGCPVIITNYMIPQEIKNLKYILKNELGFYEPSVEKVISRLNKIMHLNTEQRKMLSENVKNTVYMDSTKKIVDLLISV